MASVDVKDTDLGWDKIQSQLAEFQNSSVLIGFQEGTVTKTEVKGQREKEGDRSIPEIAAENEYGTSKIPARPFMSTSFDENRAKIQKLITRQYLQVQDGKLTANQALTGVGVVMVGLVQQKIRQIVTPPNSAKTIAEKGSSKPLIDFGQMIQSVREKVIKE